MLNVVVTGGGTIAPIDDVRSIANVSSGRFSASISEACLRLGAKVEATLMHVNPTAERIPVSFSADDTPLGEVQLERGKWTDVSFDVPRSMRGHVARVTITPDRTWSPAEHGTKDDYDGDPARRQYADGLATIERSSHSLS